MPKQHILHKIKIITEEVEKKANLKLKEKDLTLTQAHFLRCLISFDEHRCPLKELEKRMKVAQSTSAGIVLRLEKKKFIKTYQDEKDKRIKIIELTEDGIEAMQFIKNCMIEVENGVFNEFSQKDMQIFNELIEKILISNEIINSGKISKIACKEIN